ncbi:unknown protein [Synechococcus elongatus PCC 6301]|uniref:Uncharacterized protein n=1 Tax=Synechococcus sp. (strain ATCC 27144 / PCC 6301 / SAUG 1402/1) TaxID=269084 RepID=A0A0H3K388_SYNP6|nr:hypothetical protein [Synechococcus elongatus]BAD79676.1 unknown protein [Synechococcus elongatus PCC 6301]
MAIAAMSRFPEPPPEQLYAELQRLQEELLLRDQLIQQLSHQLYTELDRQVAPATASEAADAIAVESIPISSDQPPVDLQQNYLQLKARNQPLEHQLLQLPQVYQRKFEERLQPLQARLQFLEAENQRLQAQLMDELPLLPEAPTHQPVQLPLRTYVPDYSALQ